VTRQWLGATYNIQVVNPDSVSKGVKSITLNGEQITGTAVPVQTKDNVRLVAQALSNIINDENVAERGFIIGYDRRFLSDKAACWFSEVLAANNIKVSFIDKFVPTPIVMFEAKERNCAYSACITASHNPADYNGIKIFIEGGRDADEVITQKVEQQISTLTTD